MLCYKHDLEKLYRTPDYAGFYLLGLNDYSGQGTALVGVLNVFWQEKGYVDSLSFRRFCNTTVPLVRMEKFVFSNNETLRAQFEIAHYGATDLLNATAGWKIRDAKGAIVAEGKQVIQLNDKDYLLRDNVIPDYLIEKWIATKMKDINDMRVVPHPWEIARYYDI